MIRHFNMGKTTNSVEVFYKSRHSPKGAKGDWKQLNFQYNEDAVQWIKILISKVENTKDTYRILLNSKIQHEQN